MSAATLRVAAADEYVAFCEGIRSLAGIDLLQYKRGQMERRLRAFAASRGIAQLTDYLALLRRDAEELDRLLDRMTINVSQLWRNPERWEALAHEVIPELAVSKRIRVWSAGCSYGAEAYTAAAVCLEHARGASVHVKGTDIDPRVLARAAEGRFSGDDARTAPPASLRRWFEADGEDWVAARELQRCVTWERADLLSMSIPSDAYDLVMCRNVVIYFTEQVRDALHRRLACALRSGGYLVVGSTERVSAPEELGLSLSHPFTYRKR